MRLPRNISGVDLAKRLVKYGYKVTRQTGSHMRLTTEQDGQHHITIPAHAPLKIGTFNSILRDIAGHHGLSRDQLAQSLFA